MGTGNLVLLTTILAGMMSIDMVNFHAAAYAFASGTFNDPHSTTAAILMAAVMVGGMVPPFANVIGTTFFKNKYTQEERVSVSNWVLGSHSLLKVLFHLPQLTQVVIPSCIIGSAGGALVGLWHVGVPAPHGGLWVSPCR